MGEGSQCGTAVTEPGLTVSILDFHLSPGLGRTGLKAALILFPSRGKFSSLGLFFFTSPINKQ